MLEYLTWRLEVATFYSRCYPRSAKYSAYASWRRELLRQAIGREIEAA